MPADRPGRRVARTPPEGAGADGWGWRGWHEYIDPESQHPYWYNERSFESTWEKPAGFPDHLSYGYAQAHQHDAAAGHGQWDRLRHGVTDAFSPAPKSARGFESFADATFRPHAASPTAT